MPLVSLWTNIADADFPTNFENRLLKKVAETLSKPEEWICVSVFPGTRMLMANSNELTATLQIVSKGAFDKDRNPEYFPKLFEFIQSELKIPKGRTIVRFIAEEDHMAQLN